MRMWNINPKLLCRKHLLGEHVEMHMFMGCIKNGTNIKGYINKGLVEVDKILSRHNQLANEMEFRGYRHKSELTGEEFLWHEGNVCVEKNLQDLSNRCEECKERQMNIVKATIAKRISDDGLLEFEDHIPFDKVYYVDLDSAQEVHGFNTLKKVEWDKKMIVDVATGEWLPLELLKLETLGNGRECNG